MNCLGFDCSGKDVVVGVIGKGGKYYETAINGGSGTEMLITTINDCLSKAGLMISDIECIGVCVGPGSWTGARVAVSTLFGLFSGLEKKPKVFSFDVFDMIAYNEIEEESSFLLIPAYGNYIYAKKYSKDLNFEPFFTSKEEYLKNNLSEVSYSFDSVFENTKLVEKQMKLVMLDKIKKSKFQDIETIEPMYLRESQAELQLKSKR